MAVLFAVAISLPGRARAQSDTDQAPEILLHPRVSTILKLPDVIVDARLLHRGEIQFVFVDDDKLYIRPLPGTPAGTEALLEVETQTGHRTFNVRVVRRARDATRDVLILPPAGHEPSISALPPMTLVAPPVTPVPPPVTPMPPPAEPVPAAPLAEPVIAPDVEPTTKRATATARPQCFELSVHGVVAQGTTEVTVAGFEPINARQSHRASGLRFAGMRPGAWWSVEANIMGEWPAAPTTHAGDPEEDTGEDYDLVVTGPLLRTDMGVRVRLGAPWSFTGYGGMGLQAHYRDVEKPDGELSRRMPFHGVLVVGMGFEYRVANMLLGLELHVRQGVPAEYRSMSGLLSVGFFLDQGE